MFVGLFVVVLLMVMRYGLVSAIANILRLTKVETSVTRVVYASGLPAFVMSQLPQIYDPDSLVFVTPKLYSDICMPIVLGTILYSGLIGPWMIDRDLNLRNVMKRSEEK